MGQNRENMEKKHLVDMVDVLTEGQFYPGKRAPGFDPQPSGCVFVIPLQLDPREMREVEDKQITPLTRVFSPPGRPFGPSLKTC